MIKHNYCHLQPTFHENDRITIDGPDRGASFAAAPAVTVAKTRVKPRMSDNVHMALRGTFLIPDRPLKVGILC